MNGYEQNNMKVEIQQKNEGGTKLKCNFMHSPVRAVKDVCQDTVSDRGGTDVEVYPVQGRHGLLELYPEQEHVVGSSFLRTTVTQHHS